MSFIGLLPNFLEDGFADQGLWLLHLGQKRSGRLHNHTRGSSVRLAIDFFDLELIVGVKKSLQHQRRPANSARADRQFYHGTLTYRDDGRQTGGGLIFMELDDLLRSLVDTFER